MTQTQTQTAIITPAELLAHWQGHLGLTRRTLELFPEESLFTFTPAPPMRSFGTMTLEILGMIRPTLEGFKNGGEWSTELDYKNVANKAELLEAWDETVAYLAETWPKIPASRLLEEEAAYGFPARSLFHLALYLIDNEIHHRAQGYVYLRLLGIEPPSFYQR